MSANGEERIAVWKNFAASEVSAAILQTKLKYVGFEISPRNVFSHRALMKNAKYFTWYWDIISRQL